MPTNKPILQAVLDEEYKDRFDKICEEQGRTKSNLASLILKQWIDEYETVKVQPAIKTKEPIVESAIIAKEISKNLVNMHKAPITKVKRSNKNG